MVKMKIIQKVKREYYEIHFILNNYSFNEKLTLFYYKNISQLKIN